MKNRIKLMKNYFKKDSGKENDKALEFIQADIEAALVRAKALSNVEDDNLSQPLIISTPDSFSTDKKVKYRVITGEEDNYVNYDKALITSVYLSNQVLYYHETTVDHITGLVSYDVAGELNLFDVLHMETIVEYDEVMGHKTFRVYLKLNLVDGNSMTLHLRQHFMQDGAAIKELLGKDEEYIIKTIKQAVRLSKWPFN